MAHVKVGTDTPSKKVTVGATPQDTFTFKFAYIKASDVKIYNGGTLVSSSNYTLTGIAVDRGFEGGTVVLDAAVTNTTIEMRRDTDRSRQTDFPTSQTFDIDGLNTEFDAVRMILQEMENDLSVEIDRTVRVPATEDSINELASAAARANSVLGFDASGQPTLVADVTLGNELFHSEVFTTTTPDTVITLLNPPASNGLISVYIEDRWQETWSRVGQVITVAGTPAGLSGRVEYYERLPLYQHDETIDALTTNVTYYVATGGSDGNNGLSASTPFATLQKAWDTVFGLDLNGFAATISVADGTYTAGVDANGACRGQEGPSSINFVGNTTTPANVVISVTSGNCFDADAGAMFRVRGFKVVTTTSGTGLNALRSGLIEFGEMDFGACASFQIQATENGNVRHIDGVDYSITGNSTAHIHVTTSGYVLIQTATITLTGTPAFSQYFCGVSGAYLQFAPDITFSGSATGQRFIVHDSGQIKTGTGNFSYLPGDSRGLSYGASTYDDLIGLDVYVNDTSPLLVKNDADSAAKEVARYRGEGRTTPANGDAAFNSYQLENDASETINFGRITWTAIDVSDGAEDGRVTFGAMVGGTLSNHFLIENNQVIYSAIPMIPTYTVAGLPAANTNPRGLIYVSDETGGATPAFSDGANWRRVTDLAIVS